MSYKKEDVKGAVYLMAHSDDYDRIKSDAQSLAKINNGWFAGSDAVFNPVVHMLRTVSNSIKQAIWGLCSKRRADVGLKSHSAEYQRQYMSAKRKRMMAASQLKSELDGVKLKGKACDDYRKRVQSMWVEHCDSYSAGYRPGCDRNDLRREFWSRIEGHLDLATRGDDRARIEVLGEDNESWLSSINSKDIA